MYGAARRLKTIGRYPAKTLKDARIEAKRFLANLPSSDEPTAHSEAVEAFFFDCEGKNRPRTVKDYKRLLNKHFKFIGDVQSISRRDIMSRIRELQDTPSEAHHAFVAVRTYLNWCVRHGYIDASPIANITPPTLPQSRERILSEGELKEVFNRALQYPYPMGQIVALCILTGLRRTEVSTLKWNYIEDGIITLPGDITKNKRVHSFPYGILTSRIFDTIPTDTGYLFLGRGEGAWNGWSRGKKNFDKESKTTDYTLHDLRRTYASTHAQLGTPIHVIEKLLNHVSGPSFSGVAGIYNRYSYMQEMRAAVETYETHIATLVSV
jgi:integrase